LPYAEELKEEILNLLKEHKRLTEIFFFNSKKNAVEEKLGVRLIYIDTPNLNKNSCGQICHATFSKNISHFTEAQQFNSCLNKKISIDEVGNIKNCPSQKKGFGNIETSNLIEVLNNEDFKMLWRIKKDDIEICKDCEYRYICTDCRVFIQDSKNLFSKPSKCSYDPYTATW
jgi:SPASM domain peptide maturase of grasp-with-spasm system